MAYTQALRQSRALRDSVANAHVLALNSGNPDRVFNRLMATSRAQANIYVQKFGGTYNAAQTQHYIQRMTRSQLAGITDGAGSATSACHFGTTEFAKQNSDRDWILTWHHFGSARPRPSHIDADGMQVRAGDPFGVVPGMGAPGCNCMSELSEARPAPHSPSNPRVLGGRSRFSDQAWSDESLDNLKNSLTDAYAQIKRDTGLQTRWNGTIRVGQASGESVQAGRAAATKEWSCSISVADEWRAYSETDQTLTAVHEIAHSVSKGLTESAMRGYGPLEEATAEGYARALLGHPTGWAYNKWVKSMETLRKEAGVADPLTWYRTLLKTPVNKRLAYLEKVTGRTEWGGARGAGSLRRMFDMY